MKEFYGAVSLTARVGFFVTDKNIQDAEDTVLNDIQGIDIVLKDGSKVEISEINWDLVAEANQGNVSQPHVSDFEIQEEQNV